MDKTTRLAGILLPISSLPSPYGIGTLGKEAYDFVDFLEKSHEKLWQILPLNLTSYGDSPYQSPSSNGLNYYFIDFRILEEKGLLSREEYINADFGDDPEHVDYGKLFEYRIPILRTAFLRFDKTDPSFVKFVQEGEGRDFAFYMTLKVKNHYRPWYEWADDEKNYTPELEEKIINDRQDDYLFYVWTQFEFYDEYFSLKNYANSKGVSIIGDMPLYLARDSVEAYKYFEMFLFDENHNPTLVAGCPPDYFSPDGQLWGNPIYDWDYMEKTGFKWFNKRIEQNLKFFDILRIDHFRGVSAYYTIPFGNKTAREGKWVKGPGFSLFKDKTDLPIIAEDLGFMDEGVIKLLKETGYPGMKVLEFAFDGDSLNSHKPSNSTANCVCYTGTHDNMPIKGFLEELNENELKLYCDDLKKQCELFNVPYDGSNLYSLTRTTCLLCLGGPSFMSVLPIQDILYHGKESRLNEPSTLSDRNWTYRTKKSDFTDRLADILFKDNQRFGR